MTFHSQAGQDQFAWHLLVRGMGIRRGTFWDVGCADNRNNNSLALEETGWGGVLVDSNAPTPEDRKRSWFLLSDATKINWSQFLDRPVVEYLSLDIDDGTLEALKNIPLDRVTFRVATIEHDAYRNQDRLRIPIREIMAGRGYRLLCANVKCQGMEFEDWFVMDGLVPPESCSLACDGKEWEEIINDLHRMVFYKNPTAQS